MLDIFDKIIKLKLSELHGVHIDRDKLKVSLCTQQIVQDENSKVNTHLLGV